MDQKVLDPKGLIKDSYLIDGITEPECRSIFLDWALGVGQKQNTQAQIRQLLALYSVDALDHPMTRVLNDGLERPVQAARRGGRKGRLSR